MSLQPIDYLNGISSLIYVSVSIVVGLIILAKYFKLRDINFIFVGFTWIGMSEPWIPSGISFLCNLFTQMGLSLEIYVIIGNVFIPASVLCWLFAFTSMIYPEKKKPILITYFIIGIIIEVILFYILFFEPTFISTLIGTFATESQLVRIDIEYKALILAYLLFIDITMLITGILFSRESLKSESPEIKLKGWLLLLAFLFWSIGGLLDSALPLNIITLPITRLLLVLSGILFYFGFLLPPWIKRLIIKQ
ncbi:MAG: hypothetical protein GF311_02670 [Candidatus Lokiarchaeota archaeon]|nr:hypothetical protein [Candidatus Lokiarchaeota archaeon]